MPKKKMDIVYEDKYLIAINKPSGLLCVSTDKEREKTLYHEVYTYLKQKNKNNKVFIVHRLDKDTSGIVLFAKDEKIKNTFQDNWNKLVRSRKYIVLVEGITDNDGTIKSYLKETSTLLVYSTNDNDGKLAITKYKKIANNNRYSLLDIEILTGRKNQIRVHMKDIGHPIVGDTKYGSKSNIIKRLGLHAYKLAFIHPIMKKEIVLETRIPDCFSNKKMSN